MKRIFLFLCIVILQLVVLNVNSSFINPYPKIKTEKVTDDPGKPLFLTPFIEQNKIKEGQTAAQVYFNGFKAIKSYSGYLTVNKGYNSNLFFWFFPSLNNYLNDPVILWLQGGPGATSLFGLFAENGPFTVKTKKGLKLRKYAWTNSHSVIYIDNPVGTGYSFTDEGGYAQNETQVGAELYNALVQFFTLFPELQKNEFFVSGESYAGKYVPAVCYTIYKNNPTAKLKINLQGLSIGNGFSDPEHQLKYSDYLYQLGLIDLNTKQTFFNYEQQGIKFIQDKEYQKAFQLFDNLLDGDLNNKSSLFKNTTGFTNYFNFLYPVDPNPEGDYMGKYIQRTDIRAAIHVGNTTFHGEATICEVNLVNDIMQSVAPWISELLSNYRVLIYNGQLDIIVAYPLTENYLQNLNFNGADQYKTATRQQWFVGSDLAGYVKQAGNLTEVLVRNAGHMVPADQPQWAVDLITRFTRNKKLHREH